MPTQRALVTGASGFVGSHLARHLLGEDWQVHAIVRPESDRAALTRANGLRVHEYTGSMDSMLSILGIVKPDVVFHLASLSVSEHEPHDIDQLIKSNVLFGNQLIEAMVQVDATLLINTGTIWQHYEGADYSPVNLYAATKQAFEMLLQFYTESQKIKAITLELPDTYGPKDPRQKVVNLLYSAAKSEKSFLMSEGFQEIDIVHVNDVARAYLCAAHRVITTDSINYEKFSITSGVRMSLRELVSLCEKVWGAKLDIKWGARPYRKREVMKCWRGSLLPGWQPEIDLTDGLKNLDLDFRG